MVGKQFVDILSIWSRALSPRNFRSRRVTYQARKPPLPAIKVAASTTTPSVSFTSVRGIIGGLFCKNLQVCKKIAVLARQLQNIWVVAFAPVPHVITLVALGVRVENHAVNTAKTAATRRAGFVFL